MMSIPGDQVPDRGPAADVRRGGRLVEDPLHVVDLGDFVRRGVGYRDVAAGRERGQQLGDDPGRVGLVGDEVQDGQEQQRDRLVEVDQLAQRGVGQDRVRLEHVPPDHRGAGDAVQHAAGVRQHDRVVVDVDDPGLRAGVQRDLVRVAHRGQSGADVDDLLDSGLADQVADHPAEEGPVPGGRCLVRAGAARVRPEWEPRIWVDVPLVML